MVSFSLPLKEPSQNQPPLPRKPEGWPPVERQEPGKKLPGPERPSLKEEPDPTVPASLGTLQEPPERKEDIREKPPAEPQRPLTEPEEKVEVQI